MKNVIVISTSIRNGSNSEILAKKFEEGARNAGNNVEFVSLKNKTINFCKGCLACQKLHKCVINDDSNEIVEKIAQADVVVWASPIYYYEMCGQMKTLIDRANPLYVREDRKFKEVYFIATCAEDEKSALTRAIQSVEGWIECFDGVSLKGVIYGTGANNPNDTSNMQDLLDKAFNMGKSIN